MTAATKNLRFWDNNFITADAIDEGRITFSSETAGFEFTNAANSLRSRVWRPSGNFTVTASNRLFYLNDGSDKIANIVEGSYSGTGLATAIQDALNIASSNWTVTYSANEFTVSNTGSVNVRYSQTVNSIWDTIGHNYGADVTATTFNAINIRIHTDEWVEVDLGSALPLSCFAAIGPIDEPLTLSNLATIKIQANNVSEWDTPPVDETIVRDDKGLFHFFDSLADTDYRYWRFSFVDKENPLTIQLGHIYIGSHTTTASTNIGSGLVKTLVDPSRASESEQGSRFFNRRVKYHKISGASYDLLYESDRLLIEGVFDEKGTTEPFFISLDPTASVSPDLKEFTYYVNFDNAPQFKNLFRDKWSVALSFRENV